MLELRHIHKYYNPGTISEMCLFQDFNLEIQKGEFVSVVGSNGSGKTSMLNLICGSIGLDEGQILIDGKDITRQKEYKRLKRIGRVYQNPAMGTCPEMTILENLSMADCKGGFFGLQRGTDKKRIPYYQELLSQLGLGLEDKLYAKVGTLSGGQRQRVWIAMALAQNTKILFLDEPTTYLDIRYQIEILELVKKLNREYGITIIMVLHDINQAIHFSDRIIGLKDGQVTAQGAPDAVITEECIRELYGISLGVTSIEGKKFVLTV